MLRTIEEMQRFEEQLKDVEYRTKLHSAIIDTLKSELDGSKRMDRMFSLLFDTVLHTQLSWSVQFGKEPLRSYINITKLFEFIATTTGHSANVEEVVTFFKHKLDTSNVPSTKAIEPLKPTTSVSVVVNNNSNTFLTIENVPETSGTQPISAVECKAEPDVSMESRDEESNQSSTDNPGTSSGPSQRKTFITSMDKMDRFEKQLSDKKIQQQVYKWVDKTFGHEPDMEKRLQQLLNRLMDVRVFQHFKWKVHAGGHRRMIEYPNFIGLFEHACRTVEGDTAVLNTELVAKFFNKQLAYTQQRKRQYKLAKTNEHTFKLANKEKTWNDLAMPYILVEIPDPAGGTELLAVPATWIQRQEDGPAYVYWPCVRNIRKLNALFEDEYSTPSVLWERHECEILCRNIPSLASADKMIETMEMEYYQSNSAIPSKGSAPVGQPNIRATQELQTNRPRSETNYRSKDNVQKLLSCINKQLADSDPLGDVKPCPQLLDLMNELK
uniref:DUF4806 domain-containing protein n=1 Tax=Anopheles maculatus TaxID=74869 RepID=A0A182T6L1_9DIPT